MGVSMGGGSGGGRSRRSSRYKSRPMAEINITPFVDVMLVLLVIFMVTAPMMTVGVPTDLPQTQAGQLSGGGTPLTITIQADGSLFLQETAISREDLTVRLKAIAKNGFSERIFIRASARVPSGEVMKVMGRLSAAGFTRIAFVTESPG